MANVARGHITVVQEGRFLLITDEGQGLVLTISSHGLTDVEELQRLKAARTHIEVEYEGEPTIDSAKLKKIRELSTR